MILIEYKTKKLKKNDIKKNNNILYELLNY